MSPRQLIDAQLVERVLSTMNGHSVTPAELTLEITETTVMSDRSVVSDAVNALAENGISISIDDFGTGYSSLSHLQHLRSANSRSTVRSSPVSTPVRGTMRW